MNYGNGNSMDLGANSHSTASDGSRHASPACGLLDVLTWRI